MFSFYKSIKTQWVQVSVFLLFTICIVSFGYYFYQKQRNEIKNEKFNDLLAVAELKVNQILKWKQERSSAGYAISKDPYITSDLNDWLTKRIPLSELYKLETFLKNTRESHIEYNNIFLLDINKKIIFSTQPNTYRIDEYNDSLITESINETRIILSDFYQQRDSANSIYINLILPILFSRNSKNYTLGVILIQINPRNYLYPLIEESPVNSASFETLLIHREGNEIVYLNELRHKKNTAFSLRFPVDLSNLPASMALRGIEGIVEGVDYRGIEVFAAITKIKDSPWFLISKIDKDEIYQDINKDARIIIIITSFLILISGLLLLLMRRRQNISTLKLTLQGERRYHGLVETLNEGIWEIDRNGTTLFINEKMAEMLGYNIQEMLGQSLFSFMDDKWKERAQKNIERRFQGIQESHEFELVKKDGSRIITTVSSSPRTNEKGEIVGSVAAILDITEHKKFVDTQAFLIKNSFESSKGSFFESLAKHLAECLNMDYVCIDKLEDDKLTARTVSVYFDGNFEVNVKYSLKDTPCGKVVNDGICCFPDNVRKLFPNDLVLQEISAESYIGTTLRNSKGSPIGLIALIGRRPLIKTQLTESILKLVAIHAAGVFERDQSEEDLKKSHDNLEILVDKRTTELRFANESLQNEISIRKKNEEQLKENQIFIQTILNSNSSIIYIFDTSTGEIVFISQTFFKTLGYQEEDILKTKNFFNEILAHPSDRDIIKQKNMLLGTIQGGELVDYICRLKSKNGEWKWFLAKETIFKRDENSKPLQILGTATDITDQKKMEDDLILYRDHLEDLVPDRTLKLKIANADLEKEIEEHRLSERSLLKSQIILNSITEGVCTIDSNKNISSFNKAAETITGIPFEKAIHKNYNDVFIFHDRKIDFEQISLNQEKSVYLECYIQNSRGGKSPIGMILSKINGNNTNDTEIVLTFRDLSNIEILRKEISKDYTYENIIAKSPKMQKIFSILPVIAESSSSVLIYGPTGTGKELLAKAIHNLSSRKNKPYIIINCGAIPAQLMESELFGYKKGAFTDAKEDKIGKVIAADKGTLFFDEIGELALPLQVKLLRLLENFEVEPIGSIKPVKIDVRIIASTNRDLDKMVLDGLFRIDLYHRLNTVKFPLPPLTERKEDIPLIIDHYIKIFNAKTGKNIQAIDPKAMEILLNYNFPGNIRELEKIIEYSFLICEGSFIELHNLPMDLFNSSEETTNFRWKKISNQEEKDLIISALNKYEGNRTKACIELKMHYTTLLRKMKKYDLT